MAAVDLAAVTRRLAILDKIIERKEVKRDELDEIMKVPEVKKAIALQSQKKRQEATNLLAAYKQELKEQVALAEGQRNDPRLKAPAPASQVQAPAHKADAEKVPEVAASAPQVADPRTATKEADPRPADPRQAAAPVKPAGGASVKPADPRHVQQATPTQQDPRKALEVPAGAPAPVAAAPVAPAPAPAPGVPGVLSGQPVSGLLRMPSGPSEYESPRLDVEESQAEAEEDETQLDEIMQQQTLLRGAASIGFSESWFRQYMEQLPSKTEPAGGSSMPVISRKVLGANGDQMVYVDGMAPSEVLLLLQFIYMLESGMRRTGISADVSRTAVAGFGHVKAHVDTMVRRLFEELPYQCTTTGLRFSSREKLKKHTEAVFRRKQSQQTRQRGVGEKGWTESIPVRGWLESIPEWVGNRDLIVGPALFRPGDVDAAGEATRTAESDERLPEASMADSERFCPADLRRSICPISGELLGIEWSTSMNDWAFTDAVAAEADAEKPLQFTAATDKLSETTVVYKRGCFLHTTPGSRQQALRDCTSGGKRLLSGGTPVESAAGSKKKLRPAQPGDAELAKFVSAVRASRTAKGLAAGW
mmetsp:Transcript_64401/g.119754  ORF Transcript_64401/g.119754 Transcript_64401/m.119754 type:complete len:590 (+) Transcript_64401:137-1906(+)